MTKMNFKEWLFSEVQWPRKTQAWGQEVGSDEEFEDLATKWWKQKGYTNQQIAAAKQALADDEYYPPGLPQLPVWNMEGSPHFDRFKKILMTILTNEDQRKSFMSVLRKDPVATNALQKILQTPPTQEDVNNLIRLLQQMKIWKDTSNIKTQNYSIPINPDDIKTNFPQ